MITAVIPIPVVVVMPRGVAAVSPGVMAAAGLAAVSPGVVFAAGLAHGGARP